MAVETEAGHEVDARTPWRGVSVMGLALLGSIPTVVDPTPLRIAGLVALLAVTGIAWSRRSAGATNGTIALAAGLAVLVVSDVGIPETATTSVGWPMFVVLAAYPCIGYACVEHVQRHRRIRESDLIVEAALLGAAAAILVQAVVEWQVSNRFGAAGSAVSSPASSQAAVLVGLDVVVLVIAIRAFTVESARRAPVSLLAAATALLAAVHTSVAYQTAAGGSTTVFELVAVLPLLTFAAAAALDALVETPDRMIHDVQRFSPTHAVVVAVSVLAGPAVLCFQIATDVELSATVAVGTTVSALVLAWHLVSLLRERASGEHRATHDPLTDLPNRVLLLDRIERALAHAERAGTPVGILYLDLDRFKDVNDSLGHDVGDQLLAVTARRLLGCARNEDTVARIAGDEFAILLPHLDAPEDVMVVAERVTEALIEPVTLDGQRVRCPASVGIAAYPDDGRTPAALLTAADDAMYRAKDRGGATVGVFSSDAYSQAATRLEVESDLVAGLERGELVLHYQPILDVASGQIAGAEALVRWQHPTKGLLSPAEFIPVAEQSELIDAVGRAVLHQACAELTRWGVAGVPDSFIAVNVSGKQFRRDVVSDVTAALRETGVRPERLLLEITETAAVDDVSGVAERLHELRALGVRAAIDDFGTGYCGLQYLGELPVSTLKLDRSFVQSMTPSSAAIVAATIAMAHSLGLTLVAEGVETEDQRRFLQRSGCDRLQGYLLGRPMPGSDLLQMLLDQRLVAAPGDGLRDGLLDQSPWEGAAAR